MQTQQTEVPYSRLNRDYHKSFDKSTNIHWVYTQGNMKLLKIKQKIDHVTVSLLCFNHRINMESDLQTCVSVWKLPFKLIVFQTYLSIKLLSEEEKNSGLFDVLSSNLPMHQKFSKLMLFRINHVVDSLKKEAGNNCHGLTPVINAVVKGSSFDPTNFLNRPDFRDSNTFMHEVFLMN